MPVIMTGIFTFNGDNQLFLLGPFHRHDIAIEQV
jgi:hypothetical protein